MKLVCKVGDIKGLMKLCALPGGGAIKNAAGGAAFNKALMSLSNEDGSVRAKAVASIIEGRAKGIGLDLDYRIDGASLDADADLPIGDIDSAIKALDLFETADTVTMATNEEGTKLSIDREKPRKRVTISLVSGEYFDDKYKKSLRDKFELDRDKMLVLKKSSDGKTTPLPAACAKFSPKSLASEMERTAKSVEFVSVPIKIGDGVMSITMGNKDFFAATDLTDVVAGEASAAYGYGLDSLFGSLKDCAGQSEIYVMHTNYNMLYCFHSEPTVSAEGHPMADAPPKFELHAILWAVKQEENK